MPRAATVAARTAPAPHRRTAAPARRPARPSRPARTATPPRKAIRVVPRNGARPAAAAIGSGLLDRLLRGRAWIACVGALLAGVVFLNVSLLEINRGITQKAERSAELKRDNAQLRLRVAGLASSERIQETAAAQGFVLPAPADVHYVKPGRGDAQQAAERITAPSEAPAPAPQPAPPAAPEAVAPAQPQAEAPAAPQAQAPVTPQTQAQEQPPAAPQPPPAAGTGAEQAPAPGAP
ncbi:MAG: hypothetical protein WD844_16510 [Thermoleophilaceae bacterium]